MLADATASPEHGAGSSIACTPDVAHLLLEAAREANADLARDAETDANMLEVQYLPFFSAEYTSRVLCGKVNVVHPQL